MELRLYVCALLFGNYHPLHKRLVDSLKRHVPRHVKVHLWCNQVCDPTKKMLQGLPPEYTVTFSDENVPKYKAMYKMFAAVKAGDYDWVCWFDDDAHIVAVDWYPKLVEYLKLKAKENICYMGQSWFLHYKTGQAEFVAASKWYKGRALEIIKKRPAVTFAQGSYWLLRTDVLRQLDWPDERLNHNGGDTLLGEAVRQQNLPFHKNHYGVRPNDARRRGYQEPPAGVVNKPKTK
jgi:GT2 family glycosyltransferase